MAQTFRLEDNYMFDGNVTFRGTVTGLQFGPGRVTQAAAQPTTGFWAYGDIVWNSEPATTEPLGWICVQRLDTAIKVLAVATDVNIDVDSTTNMANDDVVGILLDILSGGTPTGEKEMLWTHINSITDTDTFVIHNAIPTNRRAPWMLRFIRSGSRPCRPSPEKSEL